MASPAIAPNQAQDVPLELFGVTVTEIPPADLPEGLSPLTRDVVFLPGTVQSRPGLKKLFNAAVSPATSVVYQKSYVQPNGLPLTLILTSDGKLWSEDVTNGTISQIGSTTPASVGVLYGQSVSAFGREYIALSDLNH